MAFLDREFTTAEGADEGHKFAFVLLEAGHAWNFHPLTDSQYYDIIATLGSAGLS
jgi:hypothetical protein